MTLAILQALLVPAGPAAADDLSAAGLRPVAALFDDRILADNVADVINRAAEILPPERYEYLVKWVLPSETHSTIRMNGVFTQTDPAPIQSRTSERDDIRGGVLVSPVFDLLHIASTAGKLNELLATVESVTEPADEEQQRARAAMLVLVNLELRNQEAAAEASDRLLKLVTRSTPSRLSDMWPETLVVHRGVVHFGGNAAVDDLLAYLFVNRSQRERPQGLLAWHNQIASLAGRNGHIETLRPDPALVKPPDLTQWIPVSRLRSVTRGLGLPQALWGRQTDRVDKTSGHDEDYLFFRSPLLGDYEMECDLSPAASQAMVAGTLVGNDSDLSRIWVGTMRDGARNQPVGVRFSGFGLWTHYRCVVRDGIATTFLNGQAIRTEKLSDSPDPWVSVRSWSRSHGSARDIRITGNPKIPESIDLSASSDLRGWISYHEESVGGPVARWKRLEDTDSSGIIAGEANAPPGAFFESLLCYQRPLEEIGSVDYEFFYSPDSVDAHPTLDRLVFMLNPDGVRIHWITDNQYDSSAVPPDNEFEELANRRGPKKMPLNVNAWNQLRLAVNGSQLSLILNGHQVYERALEPTNHRIFGLFHFADQTEVRVRNVKMRGNWPTSLPPLEEQELSDQPAIQLDADLSQLTSVFTHDFGDDGLPEKYFVTNDSDQRGQLKITPEGAVVVRPGGGSWLDRHIKLPFMIHGDFDIEASFDQLKTQGDGHGCIMLALQLEDVNQHQCRILRIRTDTQLQQLHASLSVIHNDGGRSFTARDPIACEANSGRLRLARRGSTLHYLFAENDADCFRIIGTEEISDEPSIADGLLMHTMCNGSGESQVTWKSVTLRAERMTLKPGADLRPPINLYAMNSDGSNLRMLSAPMKGFTQIASVEWSADGKKLIGDMSDGNVDTSRIILMDKDGSGIQDLGPGCMPSLSPDNTEIVFSQPAVGIMRMKADGSDRRVVESNGWGTQWSPDGRHIAWASGNNVVLLDTMSNTRSQLMTAEQVAQLSYVYWNLGWSSDSKSIALKARLRDQTTNVVAVADADSADGFNIVYTGSNYIPEDFAWHPDSKRVVFPVVTQPSNIFRLMIVNRDHPGDPELLPGQPANWNVQGCDWSPDGQQIVFSAFAPPEPVEWIARP